MTSMCSIFSWVYTVDKDSKNVGDFKTKLHFIHIKDRLESEFPEP